MASTPSDLRGPTTTPTTDPANNNNDDDEQDPRIRRLNQYFGAFVASLGGFALGVTLGWNSSANEVLKNVLDASLTEIGLIGNILNGGACIGIVLVPLLAKFLSRLAIMFLTIPFFIAGWALICFGSHKVSLLILGRLICGTCGGTFCVLTPIYIAEIADSKSRCRLLTFFQLQITCGIMYAFAVAHFLHELDTVWKFSAVCAVTCAPIALVNLLPESPLYQIVKKADEEAAKRSLEWYRGKYCRDLDREFEEIKKLAIVITETEVTAFDMLKNPRVLRSIFTCSAVIMAQQLSGFNTIVFYALTLFNNGGSGELTGSEQTLVVGSVQIVSCLLSSFLLEDLLGRRVLLTLSTGLMGLFLALLGWFFRMREIDPENDDIYGWMAPTWIGLFFASYNLGVGPESWALLGDVFPIQRRLGSASVAAAMAWLLSLGASMSFGELIMTLGVPKTLWIFAGFCWLSAILCLVSVKNTAGKSLAEIQSAFRFLKEAFTDVQRI